MKYLLQILFILLVINSDTSAQLQTINGRLHLGKPTAENNSIVTGAVIETYLNDFKIDSTISDTRGRFSLKASSKKKSFVKITYQNHQYIHSLAPIEKNSRQGFVFYLREDHSLYCLRWETPVYPEQVDTVYFTQDELRSSRAKWFADDISR